MTKVKRRKAPPSRIRYEQSHPVVSFRVPKDIYERLRHTKKTAGNSFADIFMAGLGKMEARAKKLEEARKEGYDKGIRRVMLRPNFYIESLIIAASAAK